MEVNAMNVKIALLKYGNIASKKLFQTETALEEANCAYNIVNDTDDAEKKIEAQQQLEILYFYITHYSTMIRIISAVENEFDNLSQAESALQSAGCAYTTANETDDAHDKVQAQNYVKIVPFHRTHYSAMMNIISAVKTELDIDLEEVFNVKPISDTSAHYRYHVTPHGGVLGSNAPVYTSNDEQEAIRYAAAHHNEHQYGLKIEDTHHKSYNYQYSFEVREGANPAWIGRMKSTAE